jgi:aryl-alcohol dehydrogenase-like predicted oxidoreductase
MRSRPLGRTGIAVSEIGFGAWGIGGATPGATSYGRTDDAASLRALNAAIACGINFFDTSNVYGYGHSEELLGQALRARRDKVVIATKAGLYRYGEAADFSAAHIRKSLEDSLRRLRSDYVDLLQLHNPPPERMRDAADICETIRRLKSEGRIRAFGVSVREPADGLAAVEHLEPDAIQANFNLLDQRALDCCLFAAAAARHCAIIARTPLCFGFLGGRIDESTTFPTEDHRSRWPRQQVVAWLRGGRQMLRHAEPTETASQFALRFCLSFEAVACVIPGMLRAEEVIENAAASRSGPIPRSILAALREDYRALGAMLKPSDPGKVDRVAQSA